MKRYLMLYKKELKNIADMTLILIFLFVIIRLLTPFYDFGIIPRFKFRYMRYIGYIFSATFYIIPVMLVYSLNIERISRTHYLALTLPFPKYSSMLFKFLAATSIGLILFFTDKFIDIIIILFTPLKFWIWMQQNPDKAEFMIKHPSYDLRVVDPFLSFDSPWMRDQLWHGITVIFKKYFWFECAGYLSQYAALCGMVCCAQGVMETAKKHRMLVWTVSFLVCLAVYAVLFEPVTHSVIFRSWVNESGYVTGYRFLVGAVTIILGLFLYEKYAEV